MKQTSFDKEKLIRAYRSFNEQLDLLSSLLATSEYSPHFKSLQNYKTLISNTQDSLDSASLELQRFEDKQRGVIQNKEATDLTDVNLIASGSDNDDVMLSMYEEIDDTNSTSSLYAPNSSLYYVSNNLTHNRQFYAAYRTMLADFVGLSVKFNELNPDISKSKLLQLICSTLSEWFVARYDYHKYVVNLVSCYNTWLDCILLHSATTCMSAESPEEAFLQLDSQRVELIQWASNGGNIRYISKQTSFTQERGGGVPSHIARYRLSGAAYTIYPNIIEELGLDDMVVGFAILLEDLIKPSLFYNSIANCTALELENNKYLHSIRLNAKSKLSLDIDEPVDVLKERFDFMLGE